MGGKEYIPPSWLFQPGRVGFRVQADMLATTFKSSLKHLKGIHCLQKSSSAILGSANIGIPNEFLSRSTFSILPSSLIV
jgi:hypothetical protein